MSISPSKGDEPKTEWTSLAITSVVTFCTSVQFTIYFSSLWPYLLQLDPAITESFFGLITSVYSIGQAIMCPVFGYIANRMGQSRIPILGGVLIMVVGNIVFLICPVLTMIPAKWTVLVSRLIIGIGAGVITVLRSYAATASTAADRSRAISLNMGAFALGLVVGPGIQIVFNPIGYPGWSFVGGLNLDMYTASAFVAILVNVTMLILVTFFFRESTVGLQKKVETENEEHARFFALPSYDRLAVAICIFARFAQMFVITNIETIGPPLTMTMFNWNKQDTVYYNSIIHGGFGIISFFIYGADIGFNLSAKRNHRVVTIVGLLGICLFHLITYPWWFLPGKITYQELYIEVNGTQVLNPDPIGCRPSFEWCSEVPSVNMYLYMMSYIFILGTAFSFINVGMNTVFSKVIGPRNQGTLTGIMLLAGCVARVCGPIFVSSIFEHFGPRPTWLIEIVISGGCTLLWIIFYSRLVPLKTVEKYAVGDSFKNKHGHVYKF